MQNIANIFDRLAKGAVASGPVVEIMGLFWEAGKAFFS